MVERSELAPGGWDWFGNIREPMRRVGGRVAEFFAPRSEAATTEDAYEIAVELPGVGDSDVNVEVHQGVLTISGEKKSSREESGKNFYFSERTYGRFSRAFRLPADANPETAQAEHKDGVLTVRIAKLVPKAPDVRKISVKRG